jgi:signal transduction histidine kinase
VVHGEATSAGGGALRRAGRTADKIIPWVLGAAVCLLSVASAEGRIGVRFPEPAAGGSPAALSPWTHPLVIVFCVISGITATIARRSRWPLFAVAAVGWLWLAAWPATVVASYYAGTTLRRRAHIMAFGLAAIAVTMVSVWVSAAIGGVRYITTGTAPNVVIILALQVGLPLAVGMWVSARRQTVEALHDRAERLEREQRARTEQARAQERTRIAREMHDIVAHRVSLMVLHAGALEVGAADERTVQTAALIRGIGREALTDLRDVLGVLRSSSTPAGDDDQDTNGSGMESAAGQDAAQAPQPTLADLDRLLDQTRDLGIRVNRCDEGEARPLSVMVELTAYRIVQEALTNVHKHAGDASTDVVLRYLPGGLEVAVRNVPSGAPVHPLPGAGLGLSGLRERVELLGGRFEAGRQVDGGFEMLARLPADHQVPR